jgi:hypothetical protein
MAYSRAVLLKFMRNNFVFPHLIHQRSLVGWPFACCGFAYSLAIVGELCA